MRAPLEYGDNFPVPSGSWSPSVPWRFPKLEPQLTRTSGLRQILPWLMLVVGVSLGILLMSWVRGEGAHMRVPQGEVPPGESGQQSLPRMEPGKGVKTGLA